MRIVESDNAKFLENGGISGSDISRNVVIKEIQVPIPISRLLTDIVVPLVVERHDNTEQQSNDTCMRPDISFAIGMFGRYQSHPGMEHWKAAKKVLRYLKGTRHCMLTYRRTDQLEVVGYSNSDFAGCVDSRKSTYGYLFLLAGGAISWKSAK
ncbi:secreted RxLR effector protein 161-like [Malania oleifera]|uniref:secreted RxLR effector protein 161-like n=1 Tax=Malania oleifera TaxID=397392 RepID=UPI0025ADC226|nr:secreted RxLR effector protein 161-like [Malania oleifera]